MKWRRHVTVFLLSGRKKVVASKFVALGLPFFGEYMKGKL